MLFVLVQARRDRRFETSPLQLWLATQRWRAAVWPGYLAAVCTPLLSTAVLLALGDALIGYPFITFFPAILLTALVGGRGAAALATLLSAFLASSYAIDASESLLPQSASAWIGMAFFLIICTIIIVLVHWLYDALDQLSVLNGDLEQRVETRTRQLTKANADLIAEAKAREVAEAQLRHSQKMQAIGQLTGGIAVCTENLNPASRPKPTLSFQSIGHESTYGFSLTFIQPVALHAPEGVARARISVYAFLFRFVVIVANAEHG